MMLPAWAHRIRSRRMSWTRPALRTACVTWLLIGVFKGIEGFGIPPLEAMACGAPVLATRVGAIPDFAGDAAMLVPPGDREALRDSLALLVRDAGLRRRLHEEGPRRASHYRWDRSAALMTELLAEAAR